MSLSMGRNSNVLAALPGAQCEVSGAYVSVYDFLIVFSHGFDDDFLREVLKGAALGRFAHLPAQMLIVI